MIIIPTNCVSGKSATFITTISLTGTGNSLWGSAVVGNNLYVGDNSNPGKVFIVNTVNNTQTGSITLTGGRSTREMIACGTNIYVAQPYGATDDFGQGITIDTLTNTANNSFDYSANNATHITADSTGDNVYLGQGGSGSYYNIRQYRSSGEYKGTGGQWINPSAIYGYCIAMVATSTTFASRKIYQSMSTGGMAVFRGDGTRLADIPNPPGTLAASTNYFSDKGLHYVGSNKAYIPGAGGYKIWIINTSTDTVSSSIDIPVGNAGGTRVYGWTKATFLESKSRIYYVGSIYSDTLGAHIGPHLFEFNTSNDTFVGMYPLTQMSQSVMSRTFACNSDGTLFYFPEYAANGNVQVYSLPT